MMEGDDFDEYDRVFMGEAIKAANVALDIGEVPVGCVLVRGGNVIAEGSNRTNLTCNATRHAELEAIDHVIRNSCRPQDALRDCELYVTVEPCIMCAAALARMKIKRVTYGCPNDKFGGNGSILKLHTKPQMYGHSYPSRGGLCASEAVDLLRSFYARNNPHAPGYMVD